MANAYLPGIDVILNDLGLKIAPPPAGPKVTFLGITSNTGVPIREPLTVSSVEKAMNTLYFQTGDGTSGKFPGELARAVEQATNAGATAMEVVVIGHYTGSALLTYTDPIGSKTGRYSDLSGAYDVLRHRELDVVVPVGIYADTTGSANNFGKQLADFCYQATSESNACVGVISTAPVLEWAHMHKSALEIAAAGSGASVVSGELDTLFADTTTARQSYLFGTPSANLVNEWVSYHGYPEGEANFQTTVSGEGNYQAGYLHWLRGAKGADGSWLSTTAGAVDGNYFSNWQATNSDGTAAVDGRGTQVDAGGFISVFTAPVKAGGTQVRTLQLALGLQPTATTFNVAGSASYAGLINSLAAQSATTNKYVNGLTSQRLLSASQANRLAGLRHTTMYQRSRGFVVAAGNTGAYNVSSYVRSDYVFLTTMRVAQAVVDLVRSVAEKYIGEPNTAPRMNALDAEINQVLLSMRGQGALNGYDFAISSTPAQRVLGELDINLTIVPPFEIRDINLNVSLSKEL